MLSYFTRRLLQAVLVLWAAFTLAFVLLQVLPGDAVLIKFQNPDLGLSPAQIEALRLAYGTSTPLWQQYLHTLSDTLHGNFGFSMQAGVTVAELLRDNLPSTLSLAVPGFVTAVVLAIAIAGCASLTRFNILRQALNALPALFVSLPAFWLGIALVQLFSFQLGWVSVINTGGWTGLILPVLTLAIPVSAPLTQILLRSIDQVQTQPFIAVARAKGAGAGRVLVHHVARNALLPVLTIAGLLLGELIAGALITETVFGRSGLGQLTQQAVDNQDVAVLQAIVMISAIGFVSINLLVDVVSPLIDPRITHGRRALS